jgi:AmmeMemoRadiSam system protein B
MAQVLRRAAVAGSWYTNDAKALAAELDSYLSAATAPPPGGRLVGLISPHAGLVFSGPVAAHGYALLRGRKGLTVVLVGPSHRVTFKGLALAARGAWETPFGTVPIDEDLAAALLACGPNLVDAPHVHEEEHSLEMQMPFLAHLVEDLKIVPILMGRQTGEEVNVLVDALGRVLAERRALLVASSDLSHYHPAPEANALDAKVVEQVERFDAEGLIALLEASHEHACGGGPMAAVMKAARLLGAERSQILRYGDSGDAGPRDKSHVVGYLSAAFLAPEA